MECDHKHRCWATSNVGCSVLQVQEASSEAEGVRVGEREQRHLLVVVVCWVGVPSYVRDPPSHAPLCTRDKGRNPCLQHIRKKKKKKEMRSQIALFDGL
jgi:hypothetical protein